MIYSFILVQLKRINSKIRSWFRKQPEPEPPRSQTFEVHTPVLKDEPEKMRATKAYADQRQKLPQIADASRRRQCATCITYKDHSNETHHLASYISV